MNNKKQKDLKRASRRARIRAKIAGTADRPRLSVFRSNRGAYVQLVDDSKGITLVSAHSNEVKAKGNKVDSSFKLGQLLAEKAKAKGIAKTVFDRGGYRYHGRVKALADGAREGGLVF